MKKIFFALLLVLFMYSPIMAQGDFFFNYKSGDNNIVRTGTIGTTTPPIISSGIIDCLSFEDMSSQVDVVPVGNGTFLLLLSGLIYVTAKNKEN